MFEAERERCYAGIRQCDKFLKKRVAFEESSGTHRRADKVLPEEAINYFEGLFGVKGVFFHLKAKVGFIRRLVDIQEAENALHVD